MNVFLFLVFLFHYEYGPPCINGVKPPTLTDSLAFGNCIRWFWQKGKFRVIQIRVRAKMSGMPRNKGLGIGAIIHRLLFFPCRQIRTVNLDRKDGYVYKWACN